MHKKYGLYETCTRYLSITKYRKLEYIKYIFQAMLRWLSIISHVYFLQRITYFLEEWDRYGFQNILLIYLAFIIVYEWLWFLTRKWWWSETIPLSRLDIFEKYVWRYIMLDNTKVEAVGTGKLIWIIQTWAYKWAVSLADLTEKGVGLGISLLFSSYLIAQYNVYYIFVFLWLLVLFLSISICLNNYLFIYRGDRYELRNNLLWNLTKVLMSKNEILQSNKFGYELDKLAKISYGLSEVNKKMWTGRMWLRRITPFMMNLMVFGVFMFLWFQYLDGSIAISQIIWLTWALIVMQSILTNFLGFFVDFTKDFVDIYKLWDFFDSTPEITWYHEWNKFKYLQGNISLENIRFWYNSEVDIFQDFNIEIKGGKITALVWTSGSGKSTLVKLIAGYIQADSGNVIIDNQKISDISLKSYYKEIGYLTQEPSVFDGTVYDNLTYALTKKPKKEVLEGVIKLAKCDFIYDFPHGVNTEIWEKWIRLSWGQRQRLAIAKIFLKDPKIIILDEPTSALDSFSEEQITKAMNNLFKWRTVIVIAHRLQTVKHADKIFVLENGKVVEEWTHNSLTRKKGIYKRMLDLQSWF